MSVEKIKAALDALQPIIFVNTTEPVRFRDLFLFPAVSAAKCPIKGAEVRRVTRVTPTSCKRWVEGKWSEAEDLRATRANITDPAALGSDWYSILTEVRTSTLSVTNGGGKEHKVAKPDIIWLDNYDIDINPGDKQNVAMVDSLREAAIEFSSRPFKHAIITGAGLRIPDVLRPFADFIDMPLPDQDELSALVGEIIKRYESKGKCFRKEHVQAFTRESAGLCETEAIQAFSTAIALYHGIDEKAVLVARERKQQKARASGLLEIRTVKKTLDSLGGLERLKSLVEDMKPTFLHPEAARKAGVRMPAGIAFFGPPGVGKSASCEAIAGTLGVGFCRFSLGALMDKWVGSSESNLRECFKMISALSPVVCQIDEADKMLGGDGAGHATFSLCKGMLLTWLEEKPPGVFIAMTMNDIMAMNSTQNSALLREGRISAVMMVDLPGRKAREEIFKIHLAAAGPGYSFTSAELNKQLGKNRKSLIDLTRGFSGSEIEGVVHVALRDMFRDKLDKPTLQSLHDAANRKKPQSVLMKESIIKLREWVNDGRAELAGEGVEDEMLAGSNTVATGSSTDRFDHLAGNN